MRLSTRIAALAAAALTAGYGGFSACVVSTALTPQHNCPPSGGPPPGLAVERLDLHNHADDVRLTAWLAGAPADRAVVLVHGIDLDGWAGYQRDLARAYIDAGFRVLVFDLRAHGRSDGNRISLGRFERGDIRAAVDLLLSRGVPPGRIGLHGTSYGAALALLAAAQIPAVGAVVADSSYADVRDLLAGEVARRVHVPGPIVGWSLKPGIIGMARLAFGIDLSAVAPESAVAHIAPRPLLLIHGGQDPQVPPDQARRLKDRAGPTAELWMIDGARHAEGARLAPCYTEPSPHRRAFLARVVSFMNKAMSPQG